jgi:hypothetical protein
LLAPLRVVTSPALTPSAGTRWFKQLYTATQRHFNIKKSHEFLYLSHHFCGHGIGGSKMSLFDLICVLVITLALAPASTLLNLSYAAFVCLCLKVEHPIAIKYAS